MFWVHYAIFYSYSSNPFHRIFSRILLLTIKYPPSVHHILPLDEECQKLIFGPSRFMSDVNTSFKILYFSLSVKTHSFIIVSCYIFQFCYFLFKIRTFTIRNQIYLYMWEALLCFASYAAACWLGDLGFLKCYSFFDADDHEGALLLCVAIASLVYQAPNSCDS